MRKLELTAVIAEEDGGYIAWVEELPGVNTQGDTVEEVRENLNEAIILVLNARREIDEQRNQHRRIIREPFCIAV